MNTMLESLTWSDLTIELVLKHSWVPIDINVIDEENVWTKREGESIDTDRCYITWGMKVKSRSTIMYI